MTREEFIEAAGNRYDGRDFYDYQKDFIKIWEDLGR
tara:strand:- start:864 stop:971 length:108 start_codon:yes stop_codon:yes gene_type:complete